MHSSVIQKEPQLVNLLTEESISRAEKKARIPTGTYSFSFLLKIPGERGHFLKLLITVSESVT